MTIGIISDTHDSLEAALEALNFFKIQGVAFVIHGGDWVTPDSFSELEQAAQELNLPLKGVLGNNDQELRTILEADKSFVKWAEVSEKDVLEMNVGSKKIAVYHGHDQVVLKALIDSPDFEIVIKGHSHKRELVQKESSLVVNPGSTAFSMPRSKDFRPSLAILDVDVPRVRFYELHQQQFLPVSVMQLTEDDEVVETHTTAVTGSG